jgi:pseudoazurin
VSRRFAAVAASTLALLALAAVAARAEEHVVKMRNNNGKGKFMLFEPDFLKAAPGDTVRFVPVDKGHNAEAMPEIWPAGAAELKGELNEEVVLTLDKPGVYAITCLPHFPMGMIAMIVAGDTVNIDQVKAYAPSSSAQKRFAALVAQLSQ